jgi:hypothetical protein
MPAFTTLLSGITTHAFSLYHSCGVTLIIWVSIGLEVLDAVGLHQ